MKKRRVKKIKAGDRAFDIINTLLLVFVFLVIFYPLYYVLIASFSDPDLVLTGKIFLLPKGFQLESYQKVLTRFVKRYCGMSLEDKVAEVKSKENYTTIEEMPQMYINAVVSVEDHRFYDHGGIDIIAIGRAFINDIKAMSFVEGGSTITQQLAKNMYFTQEKKIERKIAEVFMAWKIEDNYSKEEIFELYVNSIYFGDGYYTIHDACKRIF